MKQKRKFEAGESVYVIDSDGEIVGYMFLASVGGAVILSSFIDGAETLEETMNEHIEETRDWFETALFVYAEKDCFASREEAEEALRKERRGNNDTT